VNLVTPTAAANGVLLFHILDLVFTAVFLFATAINYNRKLLIALASSHEKMFISKMLFCCKKISTSYWKNDNYFFGAYPFFVNFLTILCTSYTVLERQNKYFLS